MEQPSAGHPSGPRWRSVRAEVDTNAGHEARDGSPSAVKATFVLTVADAVGVKRTVTAWVAPSPTSVNGLPDTMLKGAKADALTETIPPRVFCTVKTWSAKLPTFISPKLTMSVGLTEKSICATARATALTPIEQGL